jgi:ABC-type enterochelin transport system ATPase subunit
MYEITIVFVKVEHPHKNTHSYVIQLIFLGSNNKIIIICKRKDVLKVGKWPVSKSELTNRNLKQFINDINSMDFENINKSNEQMYNKTNNRNVRIQ